MNFAQGRTFAGGVYSVDRHMVVWGDEFRPHVVFWKLLSKFPSLIIRRDSLQNHSSWSYVNQLHLPLLVSNANTIYLEEQLSCCVLTRVLLVSGQVPQPYWKSSLGTRLLVTGHGWGRAQDPEARLLLSSLKCSFWRPFLTKGFATKVVRNEIWFLSYNFISVFGLIFQSWFHIYVQQSKKKPPPNQNQNNLQSNLAVNICQARLRILNVCVNGNRVNKWRQRSLKQNLVFNQHVSEHFVFWGYTHCNISVPFVQFVL